MGNRIHKAMGWGISVDRFEEIALFPKTECQIQQLYNTFDSIRGPLTAPDRGDEELRLGHPPTFQRELLEKDESGQHLFTHASDPDGEEVNHLIFYPGSRFHRTWFRHDNDMDYTFHRWANGTDANAEPELRDRVRFVAYGHYPWTNSLMERDGTPVRWTEACMLRGKPDIVAAVPFEIRYYLRRFGVLSESGMNELRPILAEWWS